ncbi:MAG: DUF998 domain-containing protein [Candidatus Saccharimonadales bacterium]
MKKNLIGQIAWVFSLQYYVIQIICGAAWTYGFSWTHNTISDLGNTVCGQYGDRFVCSPYYSLMNGSFVVLGVTTIVGAVLIAKSFSKSRPYYLGFSCMVLSGAGTIVVGLFPENTISVGHITGAALAFVAGNIGMILIGLAQKGRKMPSSLRIYSISSGIIGIIGLTLFIAQIDIGLGLGSMERIASYPQSIWMFVIGTYLLIKSIKARA